jgi:hypothetical protein
MRVQIYAFDESLVTTTRFQLLQWKHALRLENLGMQHSGGKVSTHLRKLLKTPARYPIENIQAHIETTIEDLDEQFASGEFNWQPEAPGYEPSDTGE